MTDDDNKDDKDDNDEFIKQKHIMLLGDSILDNFYWLENPINDIKQQLQDLMPNTKVSNMAVDESTIKHVLNKIKPAERYVKKRAKIILVSQRFCSSKRLETFSARRRETSHKNGSSIRY